MQLNQERGNEKVLKKTFFQLVNQLFILLYQVENRILELKYPWSSTWHEVQQVHKITKVSIKVYLGNADGVLIKYVFKPRSIAFCNLTHKAAKIPHLRLSICKSSNNQSLTLSPNIIVYLCLNTHKQSSPANIRKLSRSLTKLSHLKARHLAHQKLHHDRGVDTYGGNTMSMNFYFCLHTQWIFAFIHFF